MLDVQADQTLFQSTLSMRRATHALEHGIHARAISIHALHEESDQVRTRTPLRWRNFNPRSP